MLVRRDADELRLYQGQRHSRRLMNLLVFSGIKFVQPMESCVKGCRFWEYMGEELISVDMAVKVCWRPEASDSCIVAVELLGM